MLDSDFAFHWDGGGAEWGHLHVVRFSLEDAISCPYELKLLLHARTIDGEIDSFDLLGKLGTLRILTGTNPPVRSVHGVIVSAEDKGTTHAGSLYEIVLLPPFGRAMHRKRSRIFLEKTTKQIIEAVLKGDPKMQPGDVDGTGADDLRSAFGTPDERFAWRLFDPSRIEDTNARPYAVQYEESDFDFVSRLLEEEGISYHFEHTSSARKRRRWLTNRAHAVSRSTSAGRKATRTGACGSSFTGTPRPNGTTRSLRARGSGSPRCLRAPAAARSLIHASGPK